MRRRRWDRPDAHDHVLVIAHDDTRIREALRSHLEALPGRRAGELGRYPRFRVILARNGDEAVRRVTRQVTAVAVGLALPHRNGLDVLKEVRASRADLAILAFTRGAPASEAVAAVMAGADFFHECHDDGDVDGFARALELAIDRRQLALLIDRNEAEVELARAKLARLSGDLARALPGLRPPQSRDDVIPFTDAARRYLEAASRLFPGDAKELARRLGVSYFALRRLLARYEVPFPARSRGRGTAPR